MMIPRKNFLAKRPFIYYPFNVLILLFFCLPVFQHPVHAELRKEEAQQYINQGEKARLKGDYQEALSFYVKASALDPQNADSLNSLGVMYEQLGWKDEARKNYLAAINANKKCLPAYTNLGYLYLSEQNVVKAVRYFQQRVELGNPRDPWTTKASSELERVYRSSPYLRKQYIHYRAQRLTRQMREQEVKLFNRQLAIADKQYKKGEELFKAGQYEQALKAFSKAFELTPDNPKIIQSYNKAVLAVKKIKIIRQVEEAFHLMDQGDKELAQQQLSNTLAIVSDEPTSNSKRK